MKEKEEGEGTKILIVKIRAKSLSVRLGLIGNVICRCHRRIFAAST